MEKLHVYICENFYLEYQEALQREGIHDIQLRKFPSLCEHKGRKNEVKEVLSLAATEPGLLICNQTCDALKLIPEDASIETVTGNYCFTHLTCDEFLDYLTSQGSYIVSTGWLKEWEQRIAAMGFDKTTARRFFQESSTQIVLLDAQIDADAEARLAKLSTYLELPYVVVPVKLDMIRLLLKSKINEWHAQQQSKVNTKVIKELRSQLADYAAFFDMIGKISSYTSKKEVMEKVADLFMMVFGVQHFHFWEEHVESFPTELEEFAQHDDTFVMFKSNNRFCIKVLWDAYLYGIIDVSGFLFPQYIDRYLNLALDITRFLGLVLHNHEQYEQVAAAKEEAEAANKAKSRYLAHMNHEIRTPLNGFMGFLQLMDLTSLDQQQQEYMLHMKQSTSHLLSIINNVLDMAKIEAGEMKLSIKGFNLEEEIQTALAPLRSLAVEKNIHLALTMQDNMPRFVEGDPDRFRQIILNLGGNAVKYTKDGQVHIVIECVEISETQYKFQIVVEDTGPGMTQETLEKIFLPFYQADDGSVPQSKGTGLGMTITQELVELMGGEIRAESIQGNGTKIEVSLMLKKAKDSHADRLTKPAETIIKTASIQNKPQILVVEDNEFNQIIIKRILEKKGLSCDLVGDGQQAVEKATNHHYDLVFMDIQLPLMDGLEATRQIRSRANLPQPKIIAVTAYTAWEDRKACKEAGMDGFLAKPITFESIANVLENEYGF